MRLARPGVVDRPRGNTAAAAASGRRELRDTATRPQAPLRALLDDRRARGRCASTRHCGSIDALVVTATPDVIAELAARPDVESITPDAIDIVPTGTPTRAARAQHRPINAPTRCGTADTTGRAWSSPAWTPASMSLTPTWPPASAAAPTPGSTPTASTRRRRPTDRPRHGDHGGHGRRRRRRDVDRRGTRRHVDRGRDLQRRRHGHGHGDPPGLAVGARPGRQPGHRRRAAIVNNSWAFGTPGCNLEFQPDLQALRAAGIVPVFAAGNYGPARRRASARPTIPEALVGRRDPTAGTGSASASSSAGRRRAASRRRTYPDVVAPGVNIWTTDLHGLYGYWTGTSLARPSGPGALALLLSTHRITSRPEVALLATAVDLGAAGAGQHVRTRSHRRRRRVRGCTAAPPPTTTTTDAPPTTTTTTMPPTTTTTTTARPRRRPRPRRRRPRRPRPRRRCRHRRPRRRCRPTSSTPTASNRGRSRGGPARRPTPGRLTVTPAAARSGALLAVQAVLFCQHHGDVRPRRHACRPVANYHARFAFAPNGRSITERAGTTRSSCVLPGRHGSIGPADGPARARRQAATGLRTTSVARQRFDPPRGPAAGSAVTDAPHTRSSLALGQPRRSTSTGDRRRR